MEVPTIFITNADGRTFAVRILQDGARYGRNDCLTVEGETLVEFWDTTHAGEEHFHPVLGNFTGGRYYLSTLRGESRYSSGNLRQTGLCLHGGVPVWKVTGPNMAEVLAFAAGVEAGREV